MTWNPFNLNDADRRCIRQICRNVDVWSRSCSLMNHQPECRPKAARELQLPEQPEEEEALTPYERRRNRRLRIDCTDEDLEAFCSWRREHNKSSQATPELMRICVDLYNLGAMWKEMATAAKGISDTTIRKYIIALQQFLKRY